MISNIEETKAYRMLKEQNSPFISLVEKAYGYASDFLPKINRIFANYTGHGISHSLNVMDYMYELIDCPKNLSELELTVLIYVALLHDIGMAVNDADIEKIKTDNLEIVNRKYSLVLEKYHDETIAMQECVRPVHGNRSMVHINKMDINFFLIPGYTNISFQDDVAKICAAHNENFDWMQSNLSFDKVKGNYLLNSQYIWLFPIFAGRN
jgi:molecular chaperone HtpG